MVRTSDSVPLRGVIPPLVTPLNSQGDLDREGLERLLNRVLSGGVHGLFLLGSTGEATALPQSVRLDLVSAVCKKTSGVLPIVVGVTDTSVAGTIQFSRMVSELQIDALVVMPPFFMPLEQDELIDYVKLIAAAVDKPILLYNLPRLVGTWFGVDSLHRLIGIEQVVGFKDSSADMDYFAKVADVCRQRPDWSLLIGPEDLVVDAYRLGAHGCVAGGANVWTQLIVRLHHCCQRGEYDEAKPLAEEIKSLHQIFYGDYIPGVVRGLKGALSQLGVCGCSMAAPFRSCPEEHLSRIRSILLAHRLL